MTTLFEKFISTLDVPHTKRYANTIYYEHPYRYTLYGMSQMLSRYNIDYEVLRLAEKKDVIKISIPFIAEITKDFYIVTRVSDKEVTYDRYGDECTISYENFLEIFSGVVLIAYPTENSIEPGYSSNRKKELINKFEMSFILMYAVLVVAILFVKSEVCSNMLVLANWTLGLIGVCLSGLIIGKTLRLENKVSDRLCSLFKKQGCNNVLERSSTQPFGRYGWGQIGFAYFVVNTLIMILLSRQFLWLVSLISICALVYPLWSIWYQKYVAKSWCTLCLFVQVVLITQGFLSVRILLDSNLSINVIIIRLPFLLMSYLAMVLFVCKFTEIVGKSKKANEWKTKLVALKYKKEIYESLFNGQKEHDVSRSASNIVFGDKQSPYHITIFSNPYCNPCAVMHQKLEALYKAGCRIQYVFTYFSKELSNINKYLIASYQKHGEGRSWQLLSEWYSGGKSKQKNFFDPNLDLNDQSVEDEFKRHESWSKATGFNATPTILFNGKELPDVYNVADLLFIVSNGL